MLKISIELLNSHDQKLLLGNLLKILKKNALQEAEEPEPESRERTMTVYNLTDGLDSLGVASRCLRTLIGKGN
jgi:hypothetical protein